MAPNDDLFFPPSDRANSRPASKSQVISLSVSENAARRPSVEIAMVAETQEPSAAKDATCSKLSRFQTRRIWSLDQESARRPSGVPATVTDCLWPVSTLFRSGSSKSQKW